MPLLGYSQGGEGFVGLAIAWRPDDTTDKYAFVAPTDFLLAENKALDQAYTHIEHDASVGSRDTDQGHRHGKAAAGGPLTFALYPTNGSDIWEAGYGFKTTLAALAGDTTTAIQNGPMAPPAAPVTTPGATGGSLAAGDYEYALTFGSTYGETTLGPATVADTLGGATSIDTLTVIPVGPPGTSFRGVYRSFNDGPFTLVHKIADNTTATWADTGAAAGTSVEAPPAAPVTTPSASGGTLVAGSYVFALTFVEPGGETNLGEVTVADVLGGATSSDALSVIPVGPAGTTARNIYCKIDAGNWELIHTIPDNSATTFTFTTPTIGVNPPQVNLSLPAGVSVLALTTGDAGYNAISPGGRFVYIDVGLSQEIRTVIKYLGTPKELYVGLLGERDGRTITHTSAGCAVASPGQDLSRFINSADFSHDQSNLLPTVAVEDSIGGKYSWQYRGGYVGKIDLKSAAAKTEVTADIMFNKPRVLANGVAGNPTPTAFDDSEADLSDLSFEYQDGFLMIDSDPTSTQTPMLQRFDDGLDFEINLNNNLKEESPMDGTAVKRFLPGAKRKVDVKMKTLNPSNYPPIYLDFVSKDKDATFQVQFAINEGTDPVPVWKAKCFHIPHVRYVKSTETQGLTDTVGESVEGVARRAGGLEKIYCYSII